MDNGNQADRINAEARYLAWRNTAALEEIAYSLNTFFMFLFLAVIGFCVISLLSKLFKEGEA